MSTPATLATPAPSTFAERFWALAPGPESTEVPEPMRTIVIVRHFLAVLDALGQGPRRTVPALGALLRAAELEGCVSYASPEQLGGEPLDTRSVVFSLGVVLFERLAGRHPFGAEGNRPRRVARIQRGELGSGVNSFPTVAAAVRSVLVRAMNPFPEERWPDLRPMREVLTQFLTADAPPPRLPGTRGVDDAAAPAESTKVVRRATDFGRELMDVVARHDRGEATPRPLRPPTWPAEAAALAPARGDRAASRSTRPPPTPPPTPAPTPTPTPTPAMGVTTLRPPAPRRLVPALDDASRSDSAITRIDPSRIDPLAATVQLPRPRGLAEGGAEEDGGDGSDVGNGGADRAGDGGAGSGGARRDRARGVRGSRAASPAARAATDEARDDLARARAGAPGRGKTLLVALASAALGAGAATVAVVALQGRPVGHAPTEPAAAAGALRLGPAGLAQGERGDHDGLASGTGAVAEAGAGTGSGTEDGAGNGNGIGSGIGSGTGSGTEDGAGNGNGIGSGIGSGTGTGSGTGSGSGNGIGSDSGNGADADGAGAEPADRVHAAIAGCFAGGAGHRVVGVSIIPRGDHARAYFGNDALTPAERGCIAAAVKPLTDLPANGQYRIRVDAAGLAVSLRP